MALQVLLECWHRLAAHFAINGMDARSIAENVVSGLAWHPPPPQSKQQVLPILERLQRALYIGMHVGAHSKQWM